MLCVVASVLLLGRYLCCVAVYQLNTIMHPSLCPLNTRSTPPISRQLDHVFEDIFMTCLPHSVPLPTLLLLPLLFTDSSLMVDTGHAGHAGTLPLDHVRS